MKKSSVVFSAMLVSGLIIAGISFSSGTIKAISWHNNRLETVDYIKETKKIPAVQTLNVDVKAADIVIVSGSEAKVEWTADKKQPINVDESNGKLTVRGEADNTVIFGLMNTTPTVKITLPEGKLTRVNVTTAYGDVSMTDVKAQSSKIQVKSGDLTIEANKITDKLTIKQTYGDTKINNSSAKHLQITSHSGDLASKNSTFNEAKITSHYGDVSFNKTDLTALTLEASSGDIKLLNTVLAEKNMISNHYGDIRISTQNAVSLTVDTAYGDVKVNGENYQNTYQKITNQTNQLIIKNKSGDVKVDTN